MPKEKTSRSGNIYNAEKYRALYEDDETIGGDQLLDKTQYGMQEGKIANPTRYYLNYIQQIEILLKLAHLNQKKVLDIGCGDGIIASRKPGYKHYIGLDISQKRLDRCTQLYGTLQTEFKDVDVAYGLPFDDDSFEVVIASEIIEHVIDVPFFLNEINRVLAKGGTLIISTPNMPNYVEFEDNLYKEQHLRLYSTKKLIEDITDHGLNVVMVTGTGLQLPFGLRLKPNTQFNLLDSSLVNRLYFKLPKVVWFMVFNSLCALGALMGGKYRNQTIIKSIKTTN
jgi:2-polyprenyl-3-methyl-5-hydroxy-6-metoxy-1,4-benzoquinol methylase